RTDRAAEPTRARQHVHRGYPASAARRGARLASRQRRNRNGRGVMSDRESWDYAEFEESSRWVYLAGGALLVWLGLRRWSVPAMLVTGVGAALLARGLQRENAAVPASFDEELEEIGTEAGPRVRGRQSAGGTQSNA